MSGDPEYDRLAGWAAILAGIGGFIYSLAFIVGVVLEKTPDLGRSVSSAALAVGGLLTAVVAVALFQRAREASHPAALLGVAFALFGSMGATIHGGYDLANVLHPPVADVFAANELPNPVDPRGVLTFAAAGIGLLILVWLVRRVGGLHDWIGSLGLLVGVLLVLIYLGRLIILSPTNPLVVRRADRIRPEPRLLHRAGLLAAKQSQPIIEAHASVQSPPEAIPSAVPRTRKEPG